MQYLSLLLTHSEELSLLLLTLLVGKLQDSVTILHLKLCNLLLKLSAVLVEFLVLTLHSIQRFLDGLTLKSSLADGGVCTTFLIFKL